MISHPDRIAIIESLHEREKSVGDLARALELPATRVSQHLANLKALALVDVEAEGRSQIYRLVQPELAAWIVQGIDFVANRVGGVSDADIVRARSLWGLSR